MDEKYIKSKGMLVKDILKYNPNSDSEFISKAYDYSYSAHKGQLRQSGKPYFNHCLNTAIILQELRMDDFTISAGLLHDVVEDTEYTKEDIEENFGSEIAHIVDGVTKIGGLSFEKKEVRQAESFRKMLLSIARDIRVIIIKLADRLNNMRTLGYLDVAKKARIANETLDIYAPLAHRFGLARIKWELEDLAFKNLIPKEYKKLARSIDEKRGERENYLEDFKRPLKKELERFEIEAEVVGRAKHMYSIYNKIVVRDVTIDKIYDLMAIRIIVEKLEQCYFVLGIVHTLFKPIQERFKDFIATPKLNGYQSIHTTVIGPGGKRVEIQIRTTKMHETSEIGIAAHWKYKEKKQKDKDFDSHTEWLKNIIEWQKDASDPTEFMEYLKFDLFQDEVFVFTPKGDLHQLPRGATALDFAFQVHSEVGLHCIGAKAGSRIVPLAYELVSGDYIEIITSHNQHPNPDWLKILKTSKAKSRVKRWLRESQKEHSIKLGEEILLRELKRQRFKQHDNILQTLPDKLRVKNLDELYEAIGTGNISVKTVLTHLIPEADLNVEKKAESTFSKFLKRVRKTRGIKVQGMDNMAINFGKCCHPVPGDEIIGFITKGQGVSIHRATCSNATSYIQNPERLVDVEWDVEEGKEFSVGIQILGEDRKNFLRDVVEATSRADTNILNVSLKAEDGFVNNTLILEVKNLNHLTKILKNVQGVNGVILAKRIDRKL